MGSNRAGETDSGSFRCSRAHLAASSLIGCSPLSIASNATESVVELGELSIGIEFRREAQTAEADRFVPSRSFRWGASYHWYHVLTSILPSAGPMEDDRSAYVGHGPVSQDGSAKKGRLPLFVNAT